MVNKLKLESTDTANVDLESLQMIAHSFLLPESISTSNNSILRHLQCSTRFISEQLQQQYQQFFAYEPQTYVKTFDDDFMPVDIYTSTVGLSQHSVFKKSLERVRDATVSLNPAQNDLSLKNNHKL